MKQFFKFNKFLILLALLLVFIQLINGSPYIFGDGYGYYHTAKTLVTQGTLTTTIVPEYFSHASHGVLLRGDGVALSVYPAGVSLLWYPFLKVASIFDQGTIYNDYFKAFNGHSLADGLAILSAATFYTFLAVLLLKKLLLAKGFTAKQSYFAIAGAYIATFGLSYFTQQPGCSHTYEVFALSLFLYLLEKFRKRPAKLLGVAIGFSASLLVAIRLVDAVLFIPIGFALLKYWKQIPWMILGALPLMAFVLYFNYISFGGVLASGYAIYWGQNFDFTHFWLFEILFSDFRGLLFWSPAILLAFFILAKNYKDLWNVSLYVLPGVFMTLTICFWPYWWAGDSIGQRFLIVLVPFVALGLAEIFKQKNKYLRYLTYLLILYSLLIALFYRITPTGKLVDPASEKALHYAEQRVPANEMPSILDILKYQLTLPGTAKSTSDYLQKLAGGFNQGRSLILLLLNFTDPLIVAEKPVNNTFYLNVIPDLGASKKSGDINIFTKGRQEFLVLKNVDLSSYSRILIDCSAPLCKTENISEQKLQTDNSLNFNYVKIAEALEIWVEGSSKVNFINKKISN